VEARILAENFLLDVHYQVSQNHNLLRALARMRHAAGYIVAINSRASEVNQSIYHFQEMEQIARAINDQTLLNIALTYQGDMLRRRGDVVKAIVYFETAYDSTPLADAAARGNSAQLLGRVYLHNNDVNGFERMLAKSEEIACQLQASASTLYGAYSLGTVHEEYGKGYARLGKIQKSLDHLALAKSWLPSTRSWEMVVKATQAEALIRGNEFYEGIQMAIEVANFARSHGHFRLLERINRIYRLLDQRMLDIGRANIALHEALLGPIEH
jgi:hypothetical protein